MNRLYLVLLVFFLHSGIVQADSETQGLDITLGSNNARFMYASEILGGSFGPSNLEFGIFFNEHSDNLAHAGLFIRSESLENPFTISLGFRGYLGDVGNEPNQVQTDVGALAIGGEFTFIPKNFGGFGFAADYYIAPSVLSFRDTDNLREFGARVVFSVTEQAMLILGYRNIEVDRTDGTNIEVDSGAYFGIGLRF